MYWKNLKGATTTADIFRHAFNGPPMVYRHDVDTNTFNAIRDLVAKTWVRNVGTGADAKNLTHTAIQVKKVERIENIDLFANYANKRQEFFAKLADSKTFEPIEKTQLRTLGSPDAIKTVQHIDKIMLSDIFPEMNECYLFHGTKSGNDDNIIKKGLDPRLGDDSGMFGSAIYTAESPTKSDQYAGKYGKKNGQILF